MARVEMLISVFIAVFVHQTTADFNFRKKVPCSGIPGLSCPRRPRTKPRWDSCLASPPETLSTAVKTTTEAILADDDRNNEINVTKTATSLPPLIYRNRQDPYVPSYFLYLFRRDPPIYQRLRRAIQEDDQGEVCTWNADCPCPLICCKQGDGCPRKCMQGIRLPPPW